MGITLTHLDTVNRCQLAEMEKAAKMLDPSKYESCVAFSVYVRNVQAAVIHTYQLTAFASVNEPDAAKAALMWKDMSKFCESALQVLKTLKDSYPGCGTAELYDLTLDYRSAVETRYYQNLEDSECAKMPVPKGLFPQMS